VVEKNKKKDDAKQEEERPIDYVARQEILLGATEGVSKVEWWIGYIISIVLILVGSLGPLRFLPIFLSLLRKGEDYERHHFFSALFIIGLGTFLSLRSGKKEYEKLKRKSVN
jgi:hypothetical protein